MSRIGFIFHKKVSALHWFSFIMSDLCASQCTEILTVNVKNANISMNIFISTSK